MCIGGKQKSCELKKDISAHTFEKKKNSAEIEKKQKLRARINGDNSSNRIDSNRRFLMSRLEFDSIWWENTALGSIGKPRVLEIL